jgi:hypothetical protein
MAKATSDEQRAEAIRARLETLPPQPWYSYPMPPPLLGQRTVMNENGTIVAMHCEPDVGRFIAAAPADMAWLLGRLEALR